MTLTTSSTSDKVEIITQIQPVNLTRKPDMPNPSSRAANDFQNPSGDTEVSSSDLDQNPTPRAENARQRRYHALTEVSPYAEDEGNRIGRDPRQVSEGVWSGLGFERFTGMRAIRRNCLECGGGPSEVRKCTAVGCVFWPLRMGSAPKGQLNLPKGKLPRKV